MEEFTFNISVTLNQLNINRERERQGEDESLTWRVPSRHHSGEFYERKTSCEKNQP